MNTLEKVTQVLKNKITKLDNTATQMEAVGFSCLAEFARDQLIEVLDAITEKPIITNTVESMITRDILYVVKDQEGHTFKTTESYNEADRLRSRLQGSIEIVDLNN